ncbi:hypothetical protein BDW74DRAFT_142082 [Aspergillus multicolor]|uniref:uncharacterized protein n=1 Tax=Aspergillus multicolor TaxID=41759 RepID=UPI003CCCA327
MKMESNTVQRARSRLLLYVHCGHQPRYPLKVSCVLGLFGTMTIVTKEQPVQRWIRRIEINRSSIGAVPSKEARFK